MPALFKHGTNTFTAPEFVAESFAESWLKEIQAVVAFWLGDEPELLVQTSGSTGKPKTIGLHREVLYNSAQATLSFLGISGGEALLFMPAKYIGGKMMIIRALVGGLTLHLMEPKSALPPLEHTYDLLALTPMQAAGSLAQLKKAGHIILGGGEVSPQLEAQFQEIPFAIYNSYGMTETASHVALRRLNGPERTDYFNAMPGVLFGKDNRDCLVINAPHLRVTNLVTNDVVDLLSETRFKWLGRADHVVNSGGVKLYPEEIERQLQPFIKHPFFVAGIPDAVLGQKLILIVESRAPHKIDVTILDRIKQPKAIHFLPRFVYTETGKINRSNSLMLLS